MKSTSRLQVSVLTFSSAIAISVLAYFSFAVPLWVVNSNSTSPASPATYNPNGQYSFAINWTNVTNGNL